MTEPKAKTPDALILPRLQMSHDAWYSLLGMTPKQMNIAFKIALDESDEAGSRMCKAGDRAIAAQHDLQKALEEFRRELLAAMFRRYPAAAKRIMAGITNPNLPAARPKRHVRRK
jgi:hypothetical protein